MSDRPENPAEVYDSTTITLHWVIAILVTIQFLITLGHRRAQHQGLLAPSHGLARLAGAIGTKIGTVMPAWAEAQGLESRRGTFT